MLRCILSCLRDVAINFRQFLAVSRIEYYKMREILFMLILCSLLNVSFSFSVILLTEGCPSQCQCWGRRCTIAQVGAKRCLYTSALCFNANINDTARNIPLDADSITIGKDNETAHLELDTFDRFQDLTALTIRDNVFHTFSLTTKLKRLRFLSLVDNAILRLPKRDMRKLVRLEQMDITNNNITSIRGIRFPKRVEKITLEKNFITELSGHLFVGSSNLTTLSLAHNHIRSISPNAFVNLKKLNVLDLSYNALTVLGEQAFKDLHGIWFLDLRNNHIYEFHVTTFRHLGKENEINRQIRLENNEIRYIDKDALALLIPRRDFYGIYFAGNPIFCDCALIDIREKAQELLKDKHKMMCDSPRESIGTSLDDLFIEVCCGDEDYDENSDLYDDELYSYFYDEDEEDENNK